MNNILSYCGFVDARISASEKDLPVHINQKIQLGIFSKSETIYLHFIKVWTNPLINPVKKLPNMIFFPVKLQSKKNAAAASASTSSTTPVVTEFTVSKTFHILFIRQCLASFSLDNSDYDYEHGFTNTYIRMYFDTE